MILMMNINTAVTNTHGYCLTLNFLRRLLLSWKSSFQVDWYSWISDREGRAFLSFSLSFPPWSSLNMASVSSFSFSVRSVRWQKNRSKTILTPNRKASRQRRHKDIFSLRCYVHDPNKNLKCLCYIAVLSCNDANILLICSLNRVQNWASHLSFDWHRTQILYLWWGSARYQPCPSVPPSCSLRLLSHSRRSPGRSASRCSWRTDDTSS